MNTATKRLVNRLVADWIENPDEDYFVYHGIIEASLMDVTPITDAQDFFKAVENGLRDAMKESTTGRLRSYSDFITALHDHKQIWLK